VAVKTRGVFELPKVSAQAWTVGAPIYWDGTAGNATTVTTSNTLIGYATEAAANPSSVGRVRIG
jgi:predicted RecA/RadA family phage recombinase